MRVLPKKIIRLLLGISIAVVLGFFAYQATPVFAQSATDTLGVGVVDNATILSGTDIRVTIVRIINVALSFLGVLTLGIMLYAGFLWMTAGGSEDKVATAQKLLINAVIGLVIIMSAWAITKFVLNKLGDATGILTTDEIMDLCHDSGWLSAHPKDAQELCGNIPTLPPPPDECPEDFIAKSITPVTDDTGMNNVAIRVLFNKPLHTDFTKNQNGINKIISSITHTSISKSNFDFDITPFQTTRDGKTVYYGVEAQPKNTGVTCGGVACLPAGTYKISVNSEVTSADNKKITQTPSCGGNYPFDATFDIGTTQGKEYKKPTPDFTGATFHLPFANYLLKDVVSNQDTSLPFKQLNFVGDSMAQDLAFGFSGDTIITYPNYADINQLFANDFSISTWIRYPIAVDTQYRVIAGSNIDDNEFWVLYDTPTDNGKTHNYIFYRKGEGNTYAFAMHTFEQDDNYHHIFVSYKKDTNTLRFYLDGVVVNGITGSLQGNVFDHVSDNFFIGGIPNPTDQQKDYKNVIGNIDDFVVYGSAITDMEFIKKGFPFSYSDAVKDVTNPELTISVNDTAQKINNTTYRVYGNKTYHIDISATDDSGIGYGKLNLTSSIGSYDYFFGPRVDRGSDAPVTNPYTYSYPLYIPNPNNEVKNYRIAITMHDIDNNVITKEIDIQAYPDACISNPGSLPGVCLGGDGASCTQQSDCSFAYQCVVKNNENTVCNGQDACICRTWPYIEKVTHMNGAEGNFVTIQGYNFGNSGGHVDFDFDNATHKTANLASCGLTDTWQDSWIIVEVPAQVGTLNPSISVHTTSNKIDTTIDTFGPNLGSFTYDGTSRPGLCAVQVSDVNSSYYNDGLGTSAPPQTNITFEGKGFGTTAGTLWFGDTQASVSNWEQTKIGSQVPFAPFGEIATFVKSATNIESNTVPFTVVDLQNNVKPVIASIDPATTTAGSYITISGTGFGSQPGTVKINGVSTPELPAYCDSTWTDSQIVVKVPLDLSVGTYSVQIFTKTGLTSDIKADDKVQVVVGNPRPSICQLSPSFGPAPLPEGQTVTIKGEYFSDIPYVYFWSKVANPSDISTWLMLTDDSVDSDEIDNKGLKVGVTVNNDFTQITTPLPVDKVGGFSMKSGPIRVMTFGELLSNPIRYTVTDCREQDPKLFSTLQCCSEGPEAGSWKAGDSMCEGTTRESAYAWRLSSGIIPKPFEVYEGCGIGLPSPTPWSARKDGNSVCVNALISARFTLPVKAESIMTNDTVVPGALSIFTCGSGSTIACTYANNTNVTNDFSIDIWGEDALVLNKKQNNLLPNTWYRVALTSDITSQEQRMSLGDTTFLNQPLRDTRPCDITGDEKNDAAYCFDFKTGNSDNICTLVNAHIQPEDYTTSLLGIVQDSRYAYVTNLGQIFSVVDLFPLKYQVWGDAGNCTMIDVDDKPWTWGPIDDTANAATASKYATEKYKNSQGIATAWKHNLPDGTELFADLSKDTDSNLVVVNMLEKTGLSTSTIYDGTLSPVPSLNMFEQKKSPFSIELNVSLENLPESLATKKSLDRVVFSHTTNDSSNPTLELVVKDNKTSATTFDRYLFLKVNNKQIEIKLPDNTTSTSANITITNASVTLTAGNQTQSIASIPTDFYTSKSVWYIGDSVNKNKALYGKITKFLVQYTNANPLSIKATSTLKIDLGNPKVIDYWPSCIESCINAEIGMMFNQIMATTEDYKDTIKNAVKLYECSNESCKDSVEASIPMTLSDNLTETVVRLYPQENLKSSTWYKVIVNDDVTGNGIASQLIKAVGSLNADGTIKDIGNAAERKEWKFRTKNSSEACLVDTVQVQPDPFYAYYIGQKQTYYSVPKGAPDACNVRGQNLNPWDYGWAWSSENENIATVSQIPAPGNYNPKCTFNCLPKGSDIDKATFTIVEEVDEADGKQYMPMCGNGHVDRGEDCDIAIDGEVAGKSCTLDCLRPGNTNLTNTVTNENNHLCGDGFESPADGEQCDVNDPTLIADGLQSYCTATCLWAGSSQTPSGAPNAPVCGSGNMTRGESCDISPDPAGCSDTCLNLGTRLAQSWCDVAANASAHAAECAQALSVCGNGIIESGEECEIGVAGVLPTECSNRCLLQNVANSQSKQCVAGTEGCNDDGTFAGSSVLYSTSSICGDGVVGTGEYAPKKLSGFVSYSCELNEPGLLTGFGKGPVQIVTAQGTPDSGSSDVNVDFRTTTINAEVQQFRSSTEALDLVDDLKYPDYPVGQGEFNLQCGFDEYASVDTTNAYNNCPQNQSNTYGVGGDSCCYVRPMRTGQYPAINKGVDATEPAKRVCRNTYIEIAYDQKMELSSFNQKNIIVYQGFADADYSCAEKGWTDVTDSISLALGEKSGGFFYQLWQDIKSFFARLFAHDVFAVDLSDAQVPINFNNAVQTWCQTDILLQPAINNITVGNVETSRVSLYLTRALEPDAYVLIGMDGGLNGVRNTDGVGIKNPIVSNSSRTDFIGFRTGNEICKLAKVEVEPQEAMYTAPQTDQTFVGQGITNTNQKIVRISTVYDWTWQWEPHLNPVFDIPKIGTSSTTPSVIISSTNVEGHIDAVAQITVTADQSKENNQVGLTLSDTFSLTSYFCTNPWPSNDVVYDALPDKTSPFNTASSSAIALYTFEDTTFNYLTRYCADANNPLETYDDLPLFNRVQELAVEENVDATSDILGKYIFFSTSTSDVIGLQIFTNPAVEGKHVSISNWYINKFGDLGDMRLTTVDGYEALSNNYNYYINAYNVDKNSNPPNPNGTIFNNIYHFSINDGANLETQQVFDQIIKNLEFNTNLYDFGYCYSTDAEQTTTDPVARTITDPSKIASNISCTTDVDCRASSGDPVTGTNGYCANQKTKLFRDLNRLTQLEGVQSRLDQHFATTLGTASFAGDAKGAYLPGYTNSQWPISWNRLSGAIGGIGTDPVNQWVGCADADPSTCWKAEAVKFVCPKFKQVYEYSYEKATETYKVHVPFEFIKSSDVIYGQFVDGDKVTPEPWCTNQTFEFSAGVCGDGIVNYPVEECDPVGKEKIVQCANGTTYATSTCSVNCEWETSEQCNSLPSTCGNGLIEPGETCDDGAKNGTYGHCAASDEDNACQGPSVTGGYCGDNNFSSQYEFCDTGTANDITKCFFKSVAVDGTCSEYSANKTNSCASDCQSYGGYCGDGKVNGSEDCDDGNTIETDSCTNTCTVNSNPTQESTSQPVVEAVCGDGKVNQASEQCDLGDNNGQSCDPAYNSSCTYCTAECKIQTKDSLYQCGDGKLDVPYEKCDYIVNAQGIQSPVFTTTTPSGSGALCSDKGAYTCTNACQTPVNACVSCGIIDSNEGSKPVVTLLNPMTGGASNLNMRISLYKDAVAGRFNQGLLIANKNFAPSVKGTFFEGEEKSIETNLMCKNEYRIAFNVSSLTGKAFNSDYGSGYSDILSVINNKKTEAFSFPVDNEQQEVENEYIYSPAVLKGTIRVVVKWTDAEKNKGALLRGGILTEGTRKYSFLDYTAGVPTKLCEKMGISDDPDPRYDWYPEGDTDNQCDNTNGVYVHGQRSGTKTFIQSFTIDTTQLPKGTTYAFVVQNMSNGPIANYKYDNVTVEVYEYHEGQVARYSVYGPTKTFSLKEATGTSSNPLAKYWHVFNLVTNHGGSSDVLSPYLITRVPQTTILEGQLVYTGSHRNGSIETSSSYVLENMFTTIYDNNDNVYISQINNDVTLDQLYQAYKVTNSTYYPQLQSLFDF